MSSQEELVELAKTGMSFEGKLFQFVHRNEKDHIFSIIRNSGTFYEQELLTALRPLLKPGELVVDVGANIGNHTVFFAGVCGCKVLAFEPNPEAARLLLQNVAINQLDGLVRVQQVALGAAKGKADVVSEGEDNLGMARIQPNKAGETNVDQLANLVGKKTVRLIKIDTEGMDFQVLLGAEGVIARDKPAVCVESSSRDEFLQIATFLERYGYVATGSYNYTPTHIFLHESGDDTRLMLALLARQNALAYIDNAAIRSRVDRFGKETPTQIERSSKAVVDEVRSASGEIEGKVSKLLADHSAAYHERLAGEVKELASQISEIKAALGHVGSRFVTFSELVETGMQNVRSGIADANVRISAVDTGLGRKLEDAKGSFASKVDRLAGSIETGMQDLRAGLARSSERHAEVEASIVSRFDTAKVAAAAAEAALVARLAKIDADATSRLGEIESHLTSNLTDKFATLEKHLESRAGETESRLMAGLANLDSAIADSGVQLERLGDTLTHVGGLAEKSLEASASLQEAGKASHREVNSTLAAWQEVFEDVSRLMVSWIQADTLRVSAEKLEGSGGSYAARVETVAPPAHKPVNVETTVVKTPPVAAAGPRTGSVWRLATRGASASSPAAASIGRTGPHLASTTAPAQLRTELVGTEDFVGGWEGRAWPNGTAQLRPGGLVVATAAGDFGLVTRKVPLKGGGLFQVELDFATGDRDPKVYVSITSDADEGIGIEFVARPGAVFRAYAPERTNSIKIRLIARKALADASFKVRSMTVSRIDVDAYQRDVSARIGEPVLASMASIPSRGTMLPDTVGSLLAQCDRVRVFLNGYATTPECLNHPRVDVVHSRDWDDRGDAGKVFWLERDKQPGYRLIVDDDLIFPPDFAETMAAKVAARNKRAIYATHGVLIRQPVKNYYDPGSRAATFHFGRELLVDRPVHIGATNALCLHSSAMSMTWADFKYCNSADIWLALYAQQEKLEVLTPARPRNWVRENRHVVPDDTIYKHSLNRTRSRFDSSLVQDAALKKAWPLTVHVGVKPKYGLLVTSSEVEGLADAVDALVKRTGDSAEWVVLLAYDRSSSDAEQKVAGLKLERETHLVDTSSDPAGLRQARALAQRIGLSGFICLDASVLVGGTRSTRPELAKPVSWQEASVVKMSLPGVRDTAGLVFGENGAAPSGELVKLASEFLLNPSQSKMPFAAALRKKAVVEKPAVVGKNATINDVFAKVQVLNLDRRPDRWASVTKSLKLAGIKAERFSAVDGSLPEIDAEYEAYKKLPPHVLSPGMKPVRSQSDLYLHYESQMARIAHMEKGGNKAISSRGAWGYLRSYETILENALTEGVESTLVFDDDVLFHKDTKKLFAQAMKELPDDWLILQLGTLQYNWTPPWFDQHSPLLYRTNGSAVGSHAVGMRFDIYPFLLDQVKRRDMPYDIGALSAATKAFPDRCFVIYPNLAIQSLVDSDIGTSDFQKARKREQSADTYRWNLDEYR